MKKVLILSNSQDIHADLVIRDLYRMGTEVIRFHPDTFPSDVVIHYENSDILINDLYHKRTFSVGEIGSVWYRRPKKSVPHPDLMDEVQKRFCVDESQHLIENMYMLLESSCWVNPYFANIRARYKLLQRQLAKEIGFEMPDTIVTNNPKSAQHFVEKHGVVVYKAVKSGIVANKDGSSDLVFTNKVTSKDLEDIDQVRNTPCVFQKYIEKQLELRVTVVGDQIFSCAIHSQDQEQTIVDWRRGQSDYSVFQLPIEVEAKIFLYMERMGLCYGAFDFILTSDDRLVMLELNPNGQWAFVQGFTKLPISEALAKLLIGGCHD